MSEENIEWINTVRFDEDQNYIVNTDLKVPNDVNNAQGQQVHFWDLQSGNDIDPYDPYFGWTFTQAQEVKLTEIDEYDKSLLDVANANPHKLFFTRADKNRARVSNRNNSAANPSTPPGIQKNRDKALIDYSDATLDANDLATGIVEGLTSVSVIMALDVSTMVNWPEWEPPN